MNINKFLFSSCSALTAYLISCILYLNSFAQNFVCKGIITKDGVPVSNAYIGIYKNNIPVSMTYSNSKGNYTLYLQPNTDYQIKITKQGYKKDILFNFSTTGIGYNEVYIKNIEYNEFSTPISADKFGEKREEANEYKQTVAKTQSADNTETDITISYKGRVISENIFIEKAKVKLFLEGKVIDNAITNKKGEFSFVLYPNLKYMIMILKEGYLIGYDDIETNSQQREIKNIIELKPIGGQK